MEDELGLMASCEETPPWRPTRGKWIVYLVNSFKNAASKRWHLWEIDLKFALDWTSAWTEYFENSFGEVFYFFPPMSSPSCECLCPKISLSLERSTSLIENSTPLGPNNRTVPRALCWS